MRVPLVLLTLAACGGAADPGEATTTLPGPPPPLAEANLVLISLDTVRADHMASYGYFRETTPRLDELARESVLFERCMAPMSTTLPSHTSMLTGVWPSEHGVLANIKRAEVYERDDRLGTLSEVLSEAGYDTGAFVAAFPLRSTAGLSGGFDVYGEPTDGDRERSAQSVTDEALGWLSEREGAPFFLWAHYFDPHNPFVEHPETGAFEASDELLEWLAERAITLRAHRELVKRGEEGRLMDAVEAANLYDGEMRYMDHHVGRLLDGLRAREDWSRTVVLVVGDHGDGLNQHETPGHGYVWQEQLHVPLFVRAPDLRPGRVATTVSVVDVTATMLGRLDVDVPAAFRNQLRGADLLVEEYEPRPVIATTSARRERTDNLDEACVITGRWKYLRRGRAGASLYDLEVDPHELRDVSVLYPGVCEELDAFLSAELAGMQSRCGGRTRQATPEEIEALNALGYGGGDR